MDELLIYLLRKGANVELLKTTTSKIAQETQSSQQTISRKLLELEKDQLVERTPDGILLTKKAVERLEKFYLSLKAAFENPKRKLELKGTVKSGLGEGKYYLSMNGYRNQIIEKIGFDPYLGTLNIRLLEGELWKRKLLSELKPIIISGFKDGERTFGDLYAYMAKIEQIDCAIIVPLRTHHGQEIIELISKESLRKKFSKKDGDEITVIL
ncbi:CTP-dependent riboflavin kinase [Candidatus Micrarchaeota archaeon]|nr:CTP-dependent riboflavin kinase [Candidatus Micrarchaeota archaeon]